MKFVERQDAFEVLSLAWAAGENAFFIGPPGTAKTLTAEVFAKKLQIEQFFQYQLSPYTTVDEVFGPIDIRAFKEGKLRRKVEGFAPTAELIFFDELFKANNALLAALLDFILYKRYQAEPPAYMPARFRSVIAASNEIKKECAALYDRFTLRAEIGDVSDSAFTLMLKGEGEEPQIKHLNGTAPNGTAPSDVQVPEEIYNLFAQLRTELREQGVSYISPRRWVKGVEVVKTAAALDQCSEVEPRHLTALRFVLWSDVQERQKVETTIFHVCLPEIAEAREIVAELEKLLSETSPSDTGKNTEIAARIKSAQAALNKKLQRGTKELQPYIDRLKLMYVDVLENRLNLTMP